MSSSMKEMYCNLPMTSLIPHLLLCLLSPVFLQPLLLPPLLLFHGHPKDPLPRWYRQTLKDSGILPSDSISLGPRQFAWTTPSASLASIFTIDYVMHSKPTTWREAVQHHAMEQELESIDHNPTWTLLNRPHHKKV